MYWVAKSLQAAGMVIILLGFIRSYPEVMDRMALTAGIIVFASGWVIDRFVLKK